MPSIRTYGLGGLYLPNRFRAGLVDSGTAKTLSLPSYQKWRLIAYRHATNTDWSIAEIEMAATAGGADQCTGGSVVASFATNAANAFDNNNSTEWRADFVADSWIGYDFGSPVQVGELRIRTPAARTPEGLRLQYEESAGVWRTWMQLEPFFLVAATNYTWTFDTALTTLTDEARVYSELNQTGNQLDLVYADVAFASTVGGATLTTGGTPTDYTGMTHNSGVPTPGLLAACFDGNASTSSGRTNFRNTTSVGYNFGSNKVVNEARVTGLATADPDKNPRDVQLQIPDASGTAWRTIARAHNLTWANGETKSIPVP